MQPALSLLEQLLGSAKVDKDAYDNMVGVTLKRREDAKKSQGSYFGYLYYYGSVGKRNRYTDVMSEQQLKDTDPQVLVDLLKGLSHYQHRVAYYGPMEEKEVTAYHRQGASPDSQGLPMCHRTTPTWKQPATTE